MRNEKMSRMDRRWRARGRPRTPGSSEGIGYDTSRAPQALAARAVARLRDHILLERLLSWSPRLRRSPGPVRPALAGAHEPPTRSVDGGLAPRVVRRLP